MIYYPNGKDPGNTALGVKSYENVKWTEIDGDKLELRAEECIVGIVRLSDVNNSTVQKWLDAGNKWWSDETKKDTKKQSKPRPMGAQTNVVGDVRNLFDTG